MAPRTLDDEACPVSEETLQELLANSATAAAATLVGHFSEEQKSRLAVFCYRKTHLRRLGLEIAEHCSLRSLVEEAGRAGELIYRQSRDPQATLAKDTYMLPRYMRKPVTLFGA